jgi:hypothetical protein
MENNSQLYLGVFWIMDHYTVLHFGTCFIAWRALVPVTGTNRPTTLLQSQAALLNREHSFYCSYSFGTAALRPNSCDSIPPVVQLEQ